MGAYSASESMTMIVDDSILGVHADATTPRRCHIYEWNFGCSAAADASAMQEISRFTAVGTATSLTESPLDAADAVSLGDALGTWTGEPTGIGTNVLLTLSRNQRATYRWVAPPGGIFIVPATASNGIASTCKVAASPWLEDQTIFWTE